MSAPRAADNAAPATPLTELLRAAPAAAGVRAPAGDVSAVAIADVTDDSREVRPGALFVARSGAAADGRRFIPDAIRAGAAAILADEGPGPVELPAGASTPVVYARSAALAAAHLAQRVHGDPSARLDLIGITGTNGKTTTTHLVQQILGGAGVKCGLIGTVLVDDGRRCDPSPLTTPGSAQLARVMRCMLEHGCRAAAMEASSHALDQGRVAALAYDVGVFTNLTRDHLDYHGTMEAYAAAKARLFESLPRDGWAVVNAQDPWAPRMVRDCPASLLACRLADGPAETPLPKAPAARATATIRSMGVNSASITFQGPWGEFDADVRLIGRHNAMNMLQALSAAWCVGLPPRDLAEQAPACLPPPGRLEPVTGARDDIAVLVDYAHTDDALRQALTTLRPLVEGGRGGGGGDGRGGGRLVVVFGCGGDRDREKRPLMGRVAAELADAAIVTSDNPRREDPGAIIEQILAGVPASRRGAVRVEPDRRAAIAAAVAGARGGDVVLIAGKGHEDYQILPDGKGGTVKTRFDDREEARGALAGRRPAAAPARGAARA